MITNVLRAALLGLMLFGMNIAGGVSALAASNSVTATMEVSLHVTANCTVRADPLSFGSLNEADAPDADASSSIEVACTESTPFMVMLDDGQNAGGGARRALDPVRGRYVSYDIYSDRAHTERWGGVGSAVLVAGTSPVTRLLAYGAVHSSEIAAGDYRDLVTLTVAY
ncbi:spore coat U domain-containing protein [Altererythrobacter sp. TH136]|uniref:Csu type fimbrial protein n=1 Tax=Altererythrobacter sp. TH136 TaxID=2067415 RepID=UPI001164F4C8|nr:spore coat U domain-containing protein [Altererythrobacter sp. TH136]QDM40361.1 spore coat protein U domain-containing protein [Altererythrobacter sp. TH136]